MKHTAGVIIRNILPLIIIAISMIVINTRREKHTETSPRDYKEIASDGVIKAVTEYNTLSYHVAGDTLQGFDYELLHAFASTKGLKLEMTPEMSVQKRIEGVLNGQYDILAVGTAITSRQKDSLLFTHPILLGKQVLIQRKVQSPRDSNFIHSQLDLAHKLVYVCSGSSAQLRIHNLMEEIADTIYLKEVKHYGPEQLMAMVAGGDIDYAVCDAGIAQAVIRNFPQLDISTDIGFTQFYAWAVSKHSPILLDSLNKWIDNYTHTQAYNKLYQKYFNKVSDK